MRVRSHLNEDKSKRNFEEIIEPWYINAWSTNDYGIDAFVEIVKPDSLNNTFRNESKFFGIQLKSTESIKLSEQFIHYKVPTEKIIQWLNANLHILFVLNDLKDNKLYFTWIDETLISKLEKDANWTGKSTKTLQIPRTNLLEKGKLDKIKDYVYKAKNTTKKLILPNTYFCIKENCSKYIANLESIAQRFDFQTNSISIESLKDKIDNSIYRIAISGPSRAGKSSLINSFLRKNISPVGVFQTTGVPIQIISATTEKLSIYYLDNTKEDFSLTEENLELFASQDHNEDNIKNVKMAVIHVKNKQLEKGIAIFDIPGLDDPNEIIYDYAWKTASKANIILFLFDASPAQNGGYILRKDVKKQLNELGSVADKVFLVLTKVDALDENRLEELKKRVFVDVNKFGLKEHISDKIFYISTTQQPTKKQNYDSLQSLEDELWRFILNNNRNGLVNLSELCSEISTSIGSFEEILSSRLFDDEKRTTMNLMINEVQQKIPNLHEILFKQKGDIINHLFQQIDNNKTNILRQLENELQNVALTATLPDENAIKNYLKRQINSLIESCNSHSQYQFTNLKNVIDVWIESNLKQLREYIYHHTNQQLIDISEIEKFTMPPVDYGSLIGTSIFTGILGAVLAPIGFVVGAFSGLFGSLLFSSEDRRAKRIKKTMVEAENALDKIIPKIKIAFNNIIDTQTNEIYNYSHRKINAYTHDLQNQMNKLGSEISEQDRQLYQEAFSDLDRLNKESLNLKKEIDEYTGLSV